MAGSWIAASIVAYIIVITVVYAFAYGLGHRRGLEQGVDDTRRAVSDFLSMAEQAWRERGMAGTPIGLEAKLEVPGIERCRKLWESAVQQTSMSRP